VLFIIIHNAGLWTNTRLSHSTKSQNSNKQIARTVFFIDLMTDVKNTT